MRPLPAAGWRWLLPALVVAVGLMLQFQDSLFRGRLRQAAFDQLQTLFPAPDRQALPVRVVAIDDASLKALGQWPWPRTTLARLVDRLTAMGARVVVLDIALAEPDRTSPEQLAAFWPDRPRLAALLGAMPSHDRLLAASLARGRVAMGFAVEPADPTAPPPAAKARFIAFGGDAGDWLPRYDGGLPNLPALAEAAAGSGAMSLPPDSDGVLRAMPLVFRIGDRLYPSLGLEALRLFAGADQISLHVAGGGMGEVGGIQGIGLGASRLPTGPDGRVWLRFRPFAAERYLAAQDVLAGRVDPAKIREHLVFVGATAKGLGDTAFSPLGEAIPGVEGHVQLVEQLLVGGHLLRPTWETDLLAGLLLGEWLLLGLLLARVRPAWSLLAAALLVGGLFGLAAWLFIARQLLLDPFYPALVAAALFLALVLPRYLHAEARQRWIRDAFARYVSPNRVRYLQEHPEHLELGAGYRECSFVMTDLEDFTGLMEGREPAALASLINDYLDGLIRVAFRHDGTVERIVGDAVAVMFSAPVVQADHAARAVACALEIDAFAEAFRCRCRAEAVPFGRTRIGVHTGRVLVGNFGGQAMLDYRPLGDAVNTAARLESANAQLGTRVLVSAATVAGCADFAGRPVGRLLLKGKTEAVAVFEPETAVEAGRVSIDAYRQAFALLDGSGARDAFASLSAAYPADPLVAFHAHRLAAGETGSIISMARK